MTIKLLVADDSITVQKVVGLAFGEEDVEIESVLSGDAAMDSVRAFKPDIVLADVVMPGCNGYELCERIKEDPEFGQTPVMLLVGTFEPFDEAEASRVKCNGYLTKPFDTSELIQKVHELAQDKAVPTNARASMNPALDRPITPGSTGKRWTNSRVRDSFLGAERILDLFDPEILALAKTSTERGNTANGIAPEAVPSVSSSPMSQDISSEEFINSVADRVVRQMSPDIIRDVAWEVVPELSEILIRRVIEEQRKS
jgi:CheY-like chemotaxis protein